MTFATYKDSIARLVTDEIAKAWFRAGHQLTGSLIRDLDIRFTEQVGKISVEVWMNNYGQYMDRGVSRSNIPYERGSGAGKSLYIDGLFKYVQLRMGLFGDEALSVAFAIANKHKKTGMPIRTQGRGTGWILKATDNIMPQFVDVSIKYIGEQVQTELERIKI